MQARPFSSYDHLRQATCQLHRLPPAIAPIVFDKPTDSASQVVSFLVSWFARILEHRVSLVAANVRDLLQVGIPVEDTQYGTRQDTNILVLGKGACGQSPGVRGSTRVKRERQCRQDIRFPRYLEINDLSLGL